MFSVSQGRRGGFVLVSVLMLGTVLVTSATAFAWFARMHARSTARERISLTNRSMAQVLARAIIGYIEANAKENYDSLLQEWFEPFSFSSGELGTWAVRVVPLDDKIPLRNLFLPDGSTLRSELRVVWEDMWVKLEQRELAPIVLDFFSRSTRPRMGGAQRDTHINRPPLDISELLILEEMTPEILYGTPETLGVADYCTLWSDGRINLNMAPVHVVEILPGMNRSLAENIANYRESRALTSMDDLSRIPGFPARVRAALMNVAGFASRYFMIKIDILEDGGGGTSFRVIFDKTVGEIVRWEEI